MGFFHEVWMHPDDQELALSVTERDRKQYVQVMMDMANHLYQVEPDQVIPFTIRPLIHDLFENTIIHLGHCDISVIETPGHTAGGLSFIDTKERLLFSGDACYHTILFGYGRTTPNNKNTVSAVLQTAEKLLELKDAYDRHYYGHVAEGS